ncbi:MAG: hypothetical protein ACRDV9_14695 [Acidimicrobiia bacterium]
MLDTDQVIVSAGQSPDPRERLARFLDFSFERQHWGRVFAALCAKAADPLVGPAMVEVRDLRVAYLEQALMELGLTRQTAHDRATLTCACYVGFWRLVAAEPAWEYNEFRALGRMAAHIKETLIPPAEAVEG